MENNDARKDGEVAASSRRDNALMQRLRLLSRLFFADALLESSKAGHAPVLECQDCSWSDREWRYTTEICLP